MVSTEIKEILTNCKVEGMVVKLPPGQLDVKLYKDVAKHLNLIGGKWKGGKIAGFVFQEDPTVLLTDVAGGTKRNIKKEFQFYGTSDELSDYVVELADIQPEDRVVEPSAGQGAIIKAVHRKHGLREVYAFELMPLNRTHLEKIPMVKIAGEPDFLLCDQFGKKWDKIIANPPFAKNQDIDHIKMMYSRLKPGGRLVSIASTHCKLSSNKKETEFKNWLNEVNARVEDVPAGAFKQSGTNVPTVIIIIHKI